jgi:hypothetical protein
MSQVSYIRQHHAAAFLQPWLDRGLNYLPAKRVKE